MLAHKIIYNGTMAEKANGSAMYRTAQSNLARRPANAASLSFARYRPLADQEIRLINLAAQGEEPVLIHASLDNLPKYTAVSCCLGYENCLHRFDINGQTFVITSSLLVVFQELRRRGICGKIWVDAVCINQNDDSEKAVRIPLMGSIYRDASRVFAWLGPGSEDHTLSVEFVGKIAELINDSRVRDRKLATFFEDAIVKLGLPHNKSQVWTDLSWLLNSPWFERSWTYQEAILSRSLKLGFKEMTLSWSLFKKACRSLRYMDFSTSSHCYSSENLVDILRRIHSLDWNRYLHYNGTLKLTDIFQDAHLLMSSNATDKLYALYNLVSPEFRALVPVDLSASAQRVFIRAAKAHIQLDSYELQILTRTVRGYDNDKKLPGSPSWVPDLTCSIPAWTLRRPRGYDAGKVNLFPVTPSISMTDGEDELGLKGFTIGIVEDATHISTYPGRNSNFDENRQRKVIPWILDCIHVLERKPKVFGDQLLETVGRVLVADRPEIKRGLHTRCERLVGAWLMAIIDFKRFLKNSSWAANPIDMSALERYRRCIYSYALDSCFFVTDTGYVGFGRNAVKVGDEIAVLFGGAVPYAVRKRLSGANYELVGECYVDGIMEGQAVGAYMESNGEDQTFVFD